LSDFTSDRIKGRGIQDRPEPTNKPLLAKVSVRDYR
jgi:hypothetical protein